MAMISLMQLKTKNLSISILSAPRLKISSTVETDTTSPQKKLEIKCEHEQYKVKYEAELQLHLK